MHTYSKYRCFENSKHVLTLRVDRLDEYGLSLIATRGEDLASIIGDRLCEDSKELVQIGLFRKYGNETENLFPRSSHSTEGFFKYFQRHLHQDAPLEYEYHLGAFYVKARKELVTPEELGFFKGVGHDLLCWLLSQIDASGESVFALEADGSGSADQNYRTKKSCCLL